MYKHDCSCTLLVLSYKPLTLYSIFNLIKTKVVEFIRVAYGILQKSIHWVIYKCNLMSLLDTDKGRTLKKTKTKKTVG